jgi:RNA polymerase sigma factor (sigma-70 family)
MKANEQNNKIPEMLDKLKLKNAERMMLEKILREPIAYIPDPRFRRSSIMLPYMDKIVEVVPGQALKQEEEETLFLQMNYHRHKLCQLRRKFLRSKEFRCKLAGDLQNRYQKQQEARSRIVTANMGLVLAMAKRMDHINVEFTDLISEGSMALLRATEKFDCGRGIKFSTYACRAILKSFSRIAKQTYRYRNFFPAQLDNTFEKDDSLERLREEKVTDYADEVNAIMNQNPAELSHIEQLVVEMRFSLGEQKDHKPLTLKEVGDKLGLTKERIRQIQNKALAKLKDVAEERMVFA